MPKILLIGDSCVDKYVYGHCKKINQESPAPILSFEKIIKKDGMAKNVFNNLRSLGLKVKFITNKKKIVKTRFIDIKNEQQILRVDNDVKIKKCNSNIKIFEKYDVIVISDYNKGFIDEDFLFEITNKTNKIIFIDSKKNNLPKNNCFIKINKYEYETILNKEMHDNLIVTYGSLGARYKEKLFKTKPVKNANIIGAGDTFLAGLVYGFIKTKNIEKSIIFANKAARISVSNPGTYTLSQKDIAYLRKQ